MLGYFPFRASEILAFSLFALCSRLNFSEFARSSSGVRPFPRDICTVRRVKVRGSVQEGGMPRFLWHRSGFGRLSICVLNVKFC